MQVSLRRQLDVQRISVAEKYRPIYEKQARENQLSGLKQNQTSVSQNSSKRNPIENKIDVRSKLAKTADIMEWMINTQLGRRNLPPAQRLAVVEKFKKKIQEEAKEKQGTRTDLTSSPNGEKVKSTHTDKELAKLAGVGTGTVARQEY